MAARLFRDFLPVTTGERRGRIHYRRVRGSNKSGGGAGKQKSVVAFFCEFRVREIAGGGEFRSVKNVHLLVPLPPAEELPDLPGGEAW